MSNVNVSKKQHSKNLIINILAFGVQFIISFYISPQIVGQIGASAYGFIGLANDFVSYVAIIATVFNSVAARFIAEAFFKKDYDTANYFFNSLIVVNITISTVLSIISIVFVYNIDMILNVPKDLLSDVKLTFLLIFLSYIVSLLTLVFTTSTFVTNRTDIQGIRNILQYIIRFILIIIFLNFFAIRIYWVALAILLSNAAVAILNIRLTKKLTPELVVDLKRYKKEYVIILAKAGCWMSLTSISTILLRGLDLTIANLFIGDYEMGLLSIARTIPNNITSIINTIAPLFTPMFLVWFTKGEINHLVQSVKESINNMALILFVPITGIIVYSSDFYSLWQKSLNSNEIATITILSSLTVIQAYFNATTSTMAQISVVVNKLKIPVIVTLLCGVISLVVEILMIKVFNMGLLSIVVSTTVVIIIRYIFFNSIYAAKCLSVSPKEFLVTTLRTWILIPVLLIVMIFIKETIPISSWGVLFIDAIISAVVGYILVILALKKDIFLK